MKNTLGPILCLSALLAAVGCSSGGMGSTTTTTGNSNPGAANAYVSNQTPSGGQTDPQILGYSATSSSSTQTSMVNGPVNDTFLGLTTDSSGNLYTVDKSGTTGTYTVNEYAAGTNSSGTTASATTRTFTSASINLSPTAMRVDSSGNIYVMLTGGTVLRFAASSNEAVSPTATLNIAGGAITTDNNGNLYVAVPVSVTDNHQMIAVYSSGYASGAVATRTIVPATEMFIASLTVDASGNVYATGKDVNGSVEVAVYAAASTGSSTAMRVITGASTSLINPWSVQVDSAGNIFVADSTTGAAGSSVMMYKFAANATGNVAPTLKIATSATYSATSSMTIF